MILFNWRLRVAYLLFAAGMGGSLARTSELPLVPTVGVFVSLALLRIALESLGTL